LEDPIEYILHSKNCHVTQREVHTHTQSFGAALRGALREDPDVIMVGEMRDLETNSACDHSLGNGSLGARNAAHRETPHARSIASSTCFPVDQREQIRIMVSESLRGIVSQQLIPREDGRGRVLALEILTNTPAVAATIREAKNLHAARHHSDESEERHEADGRLPHGTLRCRADFG
jgi:twitching motility protein PilT